MTTTEPPGSAWPARDIDAYLYALTKAAAPNVGQHWQDFLLATKRQVRHLSDADAAQMRNFWTRVASAGPVWLADALTSETPAGRTLRQIAPLHALVERSTQTAVLREAALIGTHGAEWAKRWSDDPPTRSILEPMVDLLVESASPVTRDAFSDFVTSVIGTRWYIASDFCLHDDTRPNDVFAYSVFAHDAHFVERAREIQSIFPRDLKKTNSVSGEMMDYLRFGRRFHFAFIVNKDRRLFADAVGARAAIDESLAMMRNYKDADAHEDLIGAMALLRQEANANSFNYGLLQDMVLASTFAGVVALLLQLEGRAELIGWFPDRDKMTTAYKAIAYILFAKNASAFALRRKVPEAKIFLALPGPRDDGRPGIYFDELVRIPDYVAGAVASTTFDGQHPLSLKEKHSDIVAKALADNERFALFDLSLPPHPLQVRRITLRTDPSD